MKADVRVLAEGLGFAEGPVVAVDGTIYVTSISNGLVYRVMEGRAEVHGKVGGGPNGATIDADGTLYIAQNGGRFVRDGPRWTPDSVGGIQRVSPDGEVSWVTREPISPSDLCIGPDGLIYLTDLTRAARPIDGRLWRIDPRDGAPELLRSVGWFPNGIGFGSDDLLYVASTHALQILRVDVETGAEDVAIQLTEGSGPDGFAFDREGNIVIAAIGNEGERGSIQTWSADGKMIDIFHPGNSRAYTNVAFTPDGDLVITDASAGQAIIAVGFGDGLPLHPFR
jgi:gluconolactonase